MALTKTPTELAAMSQDQRDMYRKALCWNILRARLKDAGETEVGFVGVGISQYAMDAIRDDAIARMTPRGSILNTEA